METTAQTESPEFTDSETTQRRLKSQELFRGREEIIIEHGGCEYRLRKTRQDKLILTK
ncbi:MAG: hemin uptake protein HemP [Gammaproteobacteria bacterium]